jgi:adenylate kinase
MKSGQLVPLQEVLALLKDAIDKRKDQSKGFLIDGYPREVEQAISFERDVAKCTFIIYFEVSDDVMVTRLLERGKTSGRADDNEETIKQRLVTFHNHSQPIMDAYKEKVITIPAERDPEAIFADVCQCIQGKCGL